MKSPRADFDELVLFQPKIHEYAERLTELLPEPLKNVYFVNSGSEANDLAMYMARLYTGNYDIMSFRNSYHGKIIRVIHAKVP